MRPDEDYFALFGLERRYPLDRTRLDEAYERLSLEHHPDFVAGGSAEEKARAHRMSARVNEGYRVLTSELERAAYLLRLLAGETPPETDALPEGFLQAVFLLQEEVDELEEGGDPAERAALREQAEARMAEVRDERARLFDEAAAGNGTVTETFQAIQANINSERYLRRLLDRLRQP